MKNNSVLVERNALNKTLEQMNRLNDEKHLGYKIKVSRCKKSNLCKISISY